MNLPPRVFYTLFEAAAHWNCAVADIAGWAAASKLRIMTGIGLVRCGDTVVAGQVTVSPMEVCRCFAAAEPARPWPRCAACQVGRARPHLMIGRG